MVAIPDNDVADAHGGADPPRPLDLRAADLDGVAVADIFLDRRREPRRGHFKIDRAGAEAPPQRAETACEDHHQGHDHDGEALHPAFAGEPALYRRDDITEPMQTGIRSRQEPACAMTRRLVMVLIPTGIIQLRGLDVSIRTGTLGRRIASHCLSVLALSVRLIPAKASPVDP